MEHIRANSASSSSSVSSNGSSRSGGEDRLTLADGLSADTLALLQQFQQLGGRFEDEDDDEDGGAESSKPLCVAYTANDSRVIAETMRRLQRDADISQTKNEELIKNRVLLDLQESVETETKSLASILVSDGVIRVNNVLSHDLCDSCAEAINDALLLADRVDSSKPETGGTEEYVPSDGFGNVFSRKNRYDMYLRNEGFYEQALHCLLGTGSKLGSLFDELLEGQAGTFHELSALVSDCGSAAQPIHPDSVYTEISPLYTCFVALQDVEMDMGPTLFLPRTHTRECHETLQTPLTKDEMLAKSEYRRALLSKGDVTVMDSRVLHSGGANWSKDKRRTLFYFTIRNPKFGSVEADYPTGGSKWPSLHLTTHDFKRVSPVVGAVPSA